MNSNDSAVQCNDAQRQSAPGRPPGTRRYGMQRCDTRRYGMQRCGTRRYDTRRRVGATMVECAVTLPVMFFVLFAILDLGLATTRYNALAEVSRRMAREAILHGSLRREASERWGPDEFVGTLADTAKYVTSGKGIVPTVQDSDVTVRMTWPDQDNSPRDRVQVEAGYRHEPLIPVICPWGPLELRSVTTMHIVN